MTKTKMTKRDYFETLSALVLDATAEMLDSETSAGLTEFIEKELTALDKRAANAKKYASKKKAEADELTKLIQEVLDGAGDAMSIPEVTAEVNAINAEAGATAQKVTYRLTKLVEAGYATKDQRSIKEEGKATRKVNVYLAADPDEAEAE